MPCIARRVSDGTWNRLLPGEIVNLDGSGSVFVADVIDAALEERCARLDIHPTGPLWGGRDIGSVRSLHSKRKSSPVTMFSRKG